MILACKTRGIDLWTRRKDLKNVAGGLWPQNLSLMTKVQEKAVYCLINPIENIGDKRLKLKAEFAFETEKAKIIYRALLPELEDSFTDRSIINLSLPEPDSLVLAVRAEDAVSMRSALNTWFRLIQIADEVAEVAETKAA